MTPEWFPQRDETLRHNQVAWDRMAREVHPLARPASDAELESPLEQIDRVGWLSGGIRGWKVLCLAAGGGRHGPLYAAAGADVTVVDLSPAMLALDHEMARRKRLSLRTVETSMDNLSMFSEQQFDLIIHPVSTCYLPSISGLFEEIARVLRPGGLYISQHKQPINLQASLETSTGQYVVEHAYGDPSPVTAASQPNALREPGTREFVHSWTAILGGICRSGMVIEDVVEPDHSDRTSLPGTFGHRCTYIPPYIRLKARRIDHGTPRSLVFTSEV
jgi:SAM-dependent methyltransferase